MSALVFAVVLPWILIAIGAWLAYQLVLQNGRILVRLESIERLLAPRPTPRPAKTRKQPDPSLARSRLQRGGLQAGTLAPEFRLPRIDGGELSLADLRGRSVLLVFSDPDCGPCDDLAPRLQEIHVQRPELQVLVVSRRDAEATRAKAAALELTFPIVLQRHWEISREYAMFATPIAYLINEQGAIAHDVAVGVEPILALAGQLTDAPFAADSPIAAAGRTGELSVT